MPANMENSAVATGLEKVSSHSNPKERQCQRMFKLLHNCTHSHASKVMLKILQARLQQYVIGKLPDVQVEFKKGRNQRSNCQHLLDHQKSKRVPEKHLVLLYGLCQIWLVDHNKLWKILKEMGILDHLICLMRNLYAAQEATVRTGHGTIGWFQIGKGVCWGCILSPWLFNFYSEYIMRNTGLE